MKMYLSLYVAILDYLNEAQYHHSALLLKLQGYFYCDVHYSQYAPKPKHDLALSAQNQCYT